MTTPTEAQIKFITDMAARILSVQIDPNQPKLKFKAGKGNVDSKGRVHIANANIVDAHERATIHTTRLASGELTAIGASNAIEDLKICLRRVGL